MTPISQSLTTAARTLAIVLLGITANLQAAEPIEVSIFITIGQSNADGSAFFDTAEDQRLEQWYTSDQNPGTMKMWYRSSQVLNTDNALGEHARWTIDGKITDIEPQWLNVWFRNDNLNGRTMMNMTHSFGTYSTGLHHNSAQGRRGMEGQFAMRIAQQYPQLPLYMLKLGVSGAFISSWAHPADNTNWQYFITNIYRPAIADLLAKGYRPRLAGIWWMQGCSDAPKSKEYYTQMLTTLIRKCRAELGFPNAKFYIGHILAPGENPNYPNGSTAYSQSVRDAQDLVASQIPGAEIIDTRHCEMQYEEPFKGFLHFSHRGVNQIADILADKVIADTPQGWDTFTTPGTWTTDGTFIPTVGNPQITYHVSDNGIVTATLTYPGWTETKTHSLNPHQHKCHIAE